MPIASSPLRVLLVATRYPPYMGGLETHVYEVGRRLARMGMDITVLTTDLSGKLPIEETSEGVKILRVRAWPEKRDYYVAPGITQHITKGQWDLIHCQGYHTFVPPLAMLAAGRANVPYILTFHSGGHSSRLRNGLRRVQWSVLRPLFARAQKLIAVTEFESTFFQQQLRLPAEKFIVIPNGAHLPSAMTTAESINEADDATWSMSSEPLILSIGRLERYKGHQRVLAALPEIHKKIPGAQLRIIGSGPYEAALWRMARKLKVADYVEIQAVPPGDRAAMAEVIKQADLVTQLSEYESQGIAVMEALALKRPVLVASTSALQEFADRGLVNAIPLESSSDKVAGTIVNQLCRPLIPVEVTLPTWDDCAANLFSLYQDVTWRLRCAS